MISTTSTTDVQVHAAPLRHPSRAGRLFRLLASAALLTTCCSLAHAEYRTKPTAIRRADVQVGAGFSFAYPDYTDFVFKGISGYATVDLSPHYGLELMFHQVNTPGTDKIYERTYEVGPRYVRHYGRWNPYIRPAYGRGVFNFPNGNANLAYNMLTGAAGIDVHTIRHLNVRGEYEYQHWFGFPGYGIGGQQSLSPQVITFGAAYRF